jgi:organic radical activating enzyme
MIIAFYPGAGGNRYYHYLQGLTDFVPNKTYDHLLLSQRFEYRYLDQDSADLPDQNLILTHCVNVPLLQRLFPDHKDIHVIVADLDSCIQREWWLEDQYRNKNFDNKYEHAYSHVGYHYRYYQQYSMDTTGASTVIDINQDNTEFARMMRDELITIDSADYQQALSDYKKNQHTSLNDLPGDKIVQGFKSKFLDDAENMKQRLDQISPSMCLAKWKQVSLHLPTGLNNSCYHPPLHEIRIEDIQRSPSGLHNTEYKKQQRKLMLDGVRPQECGYCWAMEDNGKLSDRHYRSGEPWAAKDFGKIVSAEWNDDVIPSYVEVNFNHACNLKCSYCSPQFSSSWQQEVDQWGGYPTSTTHNDPGHFTGRNRPIPVRENNPYVDAFWDWWPTLYPELEHFRMTGGEPLLDKNTYRVFDYVLANPKPDLHLNVTSNFSVDEKSWQRYLKYVKQLCDGNRIEHFMQYISLDSFGTQAEYIRHGLDFELLWDRVNQFLTEIPGRNSITFIVTMNNLSVTGLGKLFSAILGLRKIYSKTYQRVWFDTPVLRQPTWQSLQLLPESYADQLETVWAFMLKNIETGSTRFQGFKDYEIARLDRDMAWMRDGQKLDQSYVQQNKADFYRFFTEHDRRRGTNFLKTFPEMSAWWSECEYHARQS